MPVSLTAPVERSSASFLQVFLHIPPLETSSRVEAYLLTRAQGYSNSLRLPEEARFTGSTFISIIEAIGVSLGGRGSR